MKNENRVFVKEKALNGFSGAWLIPATERRSGVLLTLCEQGFEKCEFATTLATEIKVKVFAVAALCGETPNLNAVISAYNYLIENGYSGKNITLCGSGLLADLCLSVVAALNEQGAQPPCGIVAFAPSAQGLAELKKHKKLALTLGAPKLNRQDIKTVLKLKNFLNIKLGRENKTQWLKLDNAGKMYPATRSEEWSNLFRVSATLTEEIDKEIMQSALNVTARRFPSIAVRLRKGLFWYYLEQLSHPPKILQEKSYPLTRMSKRETRRCAIRVIVYKNRVALEVFHTITDGNGALVFLKSLLAEYLEQKHGLEIPAEKGILARFQNPSGAELEDSFQKNAGSVTAKRKERHAWQMHGTPETAGFLNLTCFNLSVAETIQKAHEYNVSLTEFLAAVMMFALHNLQAEKQPNLFRRKPIKVRVPANLRRLYPSSTLRNFVMFTIPEILPELGDYTFAEICKIVHHKLGTDITPKQMSMKIATNIKSEKLMAARIMPLFVKNFIIKTAFNSVGERQACFTVSNLGAINLPSQIKHYFTRFDFILGAQSKAPHNCGIVSFGDNLYINLIRNICEPDLEMHIYKVLKELGLKVKVESNQSER